MRQLCDLELLTNGAFSPLTGFMTQKQYEGVRDNMRLPDNNVWTMPIVLDVTEDFAGKIKVGDKVALRDPEGVMLAVITVEDMYRPNREEEAQKVFGTVDKTHPGVAALLDRTNPVYLGGKVEALSLPHHYDYKDLRRTP